MLSLSAYGATSDGTTAASPPTSPVEQVSQLVTMNITPITGTTANSDGLDKNALGELKKDRTIFVAPLRLRVHDAFVRGEEFVFQGSHMKGGL
jgi:hypothetical protein